MALSGTSFIMPYMYRKVRVQRTSTEVSGPLLPSHELVTTLNMNLIGLRNLMYLTAEVHFKGQLHHS